MSSRLVLPFIAVGMTAAILCCSSSDETRAAQPLDGGPGLDAPGGGGDAATDAPPSTASGDFKSGTRLRANVLAADGVALWQSWKDTKLGVDCVFETAEDKKLRCVPTTVENLSDVTFSDSGCTQPVLVRSRSSCEKPTIARSAPSPCGGGSGVVRVGAAVETTTAYQKGSTGCNPFGVAGYDVFPVVAAIAPAELVGATTSNVTVGNGLGKTVLVAEDGASQVISIYDVTRKTACARGGRMKDDRCVPTNLAFEEGIFSDMNCMAPAALRPAYADGNDCTSPPAIILKLRVPGMCYLPEYVEVGAKVTTPMFFRKGATTCDDANHTLSPFDSYWSFGAAVPLTALPALTNLDEGAGRLKLRADATQSSARLRGRVFYDSERKEPCAVAQTSDGADRCAPLSTGYNGTDEFSDDKCEKPIARSEPGCSPPTFVEIFESPSPTCSTPKRQFFKVGAKITPAQVYRKSPCAPGPTQNGVDLYDASMEIPAASFVAITKKTE